MSLALLIAGIFAVVAGLLAVAFGFTVREFSLGSTLIISGTIGVCSGMLLVGLYVVVAGVARHRPPAGRISRAVRRSGQARAAGSRDALERQRPRLSRRAPRRWSRRRRCRPQDRRPGRTKQPRASVRASSLRQSRKLRRPPAGSGTAAPAQPDVRLDLPQGARARGGEGRRGLAAAAARRAVAEPAAPESSACEL